jgi:TonB family protein
MNETGTIRILIRVDTEGELVDYEVLDDDGHPRLAKAAERALIRSRFTPATLDGQPVPAMRIIEYRFE